MKFKVKVQYDLPQTKEYEIEASDPALARKKAIGRAYQDRLPGDVCTGPHNCEMLVDGKWINELNG